MIESLVDLTYRGLSLGRRIKLTQVRPSSGYLELALPMPVGTHIAIATEDGATFDATVSWVCEQIAGADRTPGMVVVPALAAEPAASWWKARVMLPDEDKPPRPSRSRPVTVRPRALTEPGPPPEGAITEDTPTIITELDGRIAAAAEVERPTPAASPGGPSGESGERHTTVMNVLDQQQLAQLTRNPELELGMQSTGEHTVVDDGRETMLMAQVDPAMLGVDPEASEEADAPPSNDTGGGGEAGGGEAGAGAKPAAGRGQKLRRKRR